MEKGPGAENRAPLTKEPLHHAADKHGRWRAAPPIWGARGRRGLGQGQMAMMTAVKAQGAQFEISIDGKPGSYR
jgi:hypothetical protein